jgi:hypothetical protein
MKRWVLRFAWLATVVLALSIVARPQEESSSKPAGQEQKTESTNTTNQNPDGDVTPLPVAPSPAYPVDARIHWAGKAVPWGGTTTPLRWGPLSVSSLEYFSVYDQFYPSAGGRADYTSLNILRTSIVFDRTFAKTHFVFQYFPEVAMYNNHIRGNTRSDNTVALGATFEVSPRLNVTLKDNFGERQTRQLFPDQFLLIDRETGGVVQAYFLENTGKHLENTFSAVFNYKVNPRLLLTVSPSYIYADTHDPLGLYIVDDSKNEVGLTYALSPRRNIGFIETVELLHPVRPVTSDGLFRTSAVFYSEQFAPTIWVTGELGAQDATYPGFPGNNWGMAGSFTFLKTFTNSDLAFAYFRGTTLTNFLAFTNRQEERADISYGFNLTKRLKWTNEAGYFRETGGDPRIIGKYALSSFEYRLGGGFSVFGNYARRFQSSSTQELISGNRNTFLMGLRWAPAAPAH